LSIDRSAAQPGDLLRVRWDGRDSPEKNDWIGIFPKGSKETVRSVYRMTGGSVSGEVSFDIPSGIVPGEYEFRFYAHDSWQLLATSDSIQIRLRATK
jgi:hypothetical protein